MTFHAAPPVQHGPPYYWEQIRRFGARGFTIGELHARCRDVTYTTIKIYVYGLRDLGAVERVGFRASRGNRAHAAGVYAPTRRDNPIADQRLRQNGLGVRQLQLWTAMRAVPQFMVAELAAVASTDEVVVARTTAQQYVSRLLRAGFLQVVTPHQPIRPYAGRAPGSYRLRPSANSGPAAPKIFGNRVWDPNRQDFVGDSLDGSEVSA